MLLVHFHKIAINVFLSLQAINKVFITIKMVNKTIIVALTLLLLASVATFVGVFFGVERRKQRSEHVYLKAAVAADAGPCSEVGR